MSDKKKDKFNINLSLYYERPIFKKTVDRAIRRTLIHYLGLDENYGLYRAGLFFRNIENQPREKDNGT